MAWSVSSTELSLPPLGRAATDGDASAMLKVGKCLLSGIGVEQDIPAGISWVRRAAKAGSSAALNMMGVLWDMGVAPNCELSKNQKRALYYYREAAENNDMDAITNLGFCYFTGNGVSVDGLEACRWLSRAARNGHPKAQLFLGKLYLAGSPGIDADHQAAVFYFQNAAQKGELEAHSHLGCCYQKGTGVLKDLHMAEKHFRIAADAGDTGAACELGLLLCMTEEFSQALPYLEAASSSRECSEACYALGRLYELGLGTPTAMDNAVAYFQLGAESGHNGCTAALTRLGENPLHQPPVTSENAEVTSLHCGQGLAGSRLVTENSCTDIMLSPRSPSSHHVGDMSDVSSDGALGSEDAFYDAKESHSLHQSPVSVTSKISEEVQEDKARGEGNMALGDAAVSAALEALGINEESLAETSISPRERHLGTQSIDESAGEDMRLTRCKLLRKNASLSSETSEKGTSWSRRLGPNSSQVSEADKSGDRNTGRGSFLTRAMSIPPRKPLKMRRLTDQSLGSKHVSVTSIKDLAMSMRFGGDVDNKPHVEASMRRGEVQRSASREIISGSSKWPFMSREDSALKSSLNTFCMDNYRLTKELHELRTALEEERTLAVAMESTVQRFWLRILALESQIRDLGADPFVPAEETREEVLEQIVESIAKPELQPIVEMDQSPLS
mmetsp:Transcript_25655/g.71779  ORF Transcript_25655/g.71779 Transcript_25655/m.71779 type:complete len:673 (-) Transcript_25655:90-2108(-)